jgi:DNA repair exonuclease SbcCD ATPase subunit
MGGHLSLTVLEIVVLLMGAVVLGVAIQFIISSSRAFKKMVGEAPGGKISNELAELKLKYSHDTERKNREISELSALLTDLKENSEINAIEADEMRKQNKLLLAEIENLHRRTNEDSKTVYIEQLRMTQSALKDQQEKIDMLLQKIEETDENEKKYVQLMESNKRLTEQVSSLSEKLKNKERDAARIAKEENITTEINSLLDAAYAQFNELQGKIEKLETQLSISKKESLDNAELKENYYKLQQDFRELKQKYTALETTSREMELNLSETQSKLRESNFDRQQLQKKISYLEEMNNDLEAVAAANRNLEKQLKRISELESLLNIVSGERDELARRQSNS